TSSATTRAMSRCIPNSGPIFASTSRHFWQLGARTTHFSCRRALKRLSVTFQTLTCASSTPATSPSRRTVTRSLQQSTISCRAPSDVRHLVENVKPSEEWPDARNVLEKFGGPHSLVIKRIPEPEPRAGHVLIQVKAFGINLAEMHMRWGEW